MNPQAPEATYPQLEDDPAYRAHAEFTRLRAVQIRERLEDACNDLHGVLTAYEQLGEIDCGGDCCVGAGPRRDAEAFIADALRALRAARALTQRDTI